MEVILLERIRNLGQMGDRVTVKPGFARNFLLPQRKALRATEENVTYFEAEKKQLEAQNFERRKEAEDMAGRIKGVNVTLIRQAGESGQLYGSVSARDIADGVTDAGYTVERSQVVLDKPIKALGIYRITLHLHPEVETEITINVARTEEEAAAQQAETVEEVDVAEAVESVFETEELAKQAEEELTEEAEAAEDENATQEAETEDPKTGE